MLMNRNEFLALTSETGEFHRALLDLQGGGVDIDTFRFAFSDEESEEGLQIGYSMPISAIRPFLRAYNPSNPVDENFYYLLSEFR